MDKIKLEVKIQEMNEISKPKHPQKSIIFFIHLINIC